MKFLQKLGKIPDASCSDTADLWYPHGVSDICSAREQCRALQKDIPFLLLSRLDTIW